MRHIRSALLFPPVHIFAWMFVAIFLKLKVWWVPGMVLLGTMGSMLLATMLVVIFGTHR